MEGLLNLKSIIITRLLFDSYLLINSKWFLECLTLVRTTLPYPLWLKRAEPVADLFVSLNSATNIIVYTCMSEQFRDAIQYTLES